MAISRCHQGNCFSDAHENRTRFYAGQEKRTHKLTSYLNVTLLKKVKEKSYFRLEFSQAVLATVHDSNKIELKYITELK